MAERSVEVGELGIRLLVAPGTLLREAVDLVLRQESGALIVLGDDSMVDGVCSGGFDLDGAEFTPQRLAELAKMDGAIVIDRSVQYILKANVHLIPDSTIETKETGTRLRTAERVARQTGCPTISVSEDRTSATIFGPTGRYELESTTSLMGKANQSILSLERFRRRLEEAEEQLTYAEIEDAVTYRDVVTVLQRAALVKRLGDDLRNYAIELGGEGELIRLQLSDLGEGVELLADLIYQDYARRRGRQTGALDRLDELPTVSLYDASKVGHALGLTPLDGEARPRGTRLLEQVPRVPETVKAALISHFGDLQKMLQATAAEFDRVEGVGPARARQLRNYFDGLAGLSPLWGSAED